MAAAIARAINTTSTLTSSAKLFLYSTSYPPLPFARPPLLLLLSHTHRLLSPASPTSSHFTPIRCCQNRSGDSSLPLKSGSNFSDRLLTKMAPLFPLCDYEHWLILMDKPGGPGATKQQMIDCYVQTLATVVGSEEEAMKKIYKVSCVKRPFGFGCEIDEGTSIKLKGLSSVVFVVPDSYVDPPNSYVDPLHWNPLHWNAFLPYFQYFDGLWCAGGGMITPIYFDRAIYPPHPLYDEYGEGKYGSILPAMQDMKKRLGALSWDKRNMINKTMSQIEEAEKSMTASFGSLDLQDQRDIVRKIERVEVAVLELRDHIERMEFGLTEYLKQLHCLVSRRTWFDPFLVWKPRSFKR